MTVGALLREITPKELNYWMALARIEHEEWEHRNVNQQAMAGLEKWKNKT